MCVKNSLCPVLLLPQMARRRSCVVVALLVGIVVIILLNGLVIFPWTSLRHSVAEDAIEGQEQLIERLTEELLTVREVSQQLVAGAVSPFDRKVRDALIGGHKDVLKLLNSPEFSTEIGKRAKEKDAQQSFAAISTKPGPAGRHRRLHCFAAI